MIVRTLGLLSPSRLRLRPALQRLLSGAGRLYTTHGTSTKLLLCGVCVCDPRVDSDCGLHESCWWYVMGVSENLNSKWWHTTNSATGSSRENFSGLGNSGRTSLIHVAYPIQIHPPPARDKKLVTPKQIGSQLKEPILLSTSSTKTENLLAIACFSLSIQFTEDKCRCWAGRCPWVLAAASERSRYTGTEADKNEKLLFVSSEATNVRTTDGQYRKFRLRMRMRKRKQNRMRMILAYYAR